MDSAINGKCLVLAEDPFSTYFSRNLENMDTSADLVIEDSGDNKSTGTIEDTFHVGSSENKESNVTPEDPLHTKSSDDKESKVTPGGTFHMGITNEKINVTPGDTVYVGSSEDIESKEDTFHVGSSASEASKMSCVDMFNMGPSADEDSKVTPEDTFDVSSSEDKESKVSLVDTLHIGSAEDMQSKVSHGDTCHVGSSADEESNVTPGDMLHLGSSDDNESNVSQEDTLHMGSSEDIKSNVIHGDMGSSADEKSNVTPGDILYIGSSEDNESKVPPGDILHMGSSEDMQNNVTNGNTFQMESSEDKENNVIPADTLHVRSSVDKESKVSSEDMFHMVITDDDENIGVCAGYMESIDPHIQPNGDVFHIDFLDDKKILGSSSDIYKMDNAGETLQLYSSEEVESTNHEKDTFPITHPRGHLFHVYPPDHDEMIGSGRESYKEDSPGDSLYSSGFLHKMGSQIFSPKDEIINAEKTDRIPEQITPIPISRLFEQDYKAFLNQLENMNPMIHTIFDISEYTGESRKRTIDEALQQLNLERYRASKLSLTDVLKIGKETFKKSTPQSIEDVPWYFLQNLMALDGSARNTRLDQSTLDIKTSNGQDEDLDFMNEVDVSNSIHPLDVLCLLLLCSDSFLQQEILTKMSMCQFAVPLLLPAGEGTECTFMLWAMRDILKRWRPRSLVDSKGCKEDNLVNIPMPTFSFVKMGKCNLSKSRILNHILSPVQQHHDFFVHQNMEGGNVLREISDGLVEIAWYFPGGRENSDLFLDPVAVTNLRGDLESNWKQFSFITQISSAVFIFTENINEKEYELLSNPDIGDTNYFLIIAPSSKHVNKATQKHIKMLYPVLKINRKNVLVKNSSVNDAELVKKLQIIMADLMKCSQHYVNLEDMSRMASELGIQIDENLEENQNARTVALEITKNIKDIVEYKNQTLTLQGTLWKKLAKVEKELCRMKKQGNQNAEDYRSKLVKERSELRMKQHQHASSDGMKKFIAAITNLSQTEKHYFLKWMKLYLDSNARRNLGTLQREYKENCYNLSANPERLIELDQRISNSSLGVEHFLRELGQYYEAECSMTSEGKIEQKQRKFGKLPGIAADLLLDGFPLELIDGDASNISLQWITDVLTELDHRIGRQCRMRVITVVGVQSTGKSTLLNTMFGLQFPVASGRCTRGAFMTLIKMRDNFQEELGCDFVLVIDTEGLKAPELATVEDSYEHDNELATLVVGLSDIAIINMAMENTAEMKDILQIVVHAFLRMKEIGKKPNCQFVHQNVSDVSAHEKNMRDRKKLLEQLDEMTNLAAKMEERSNITKFSDIMEYDLEEHSWYIPGLWHGVPPMASVNKGYSDNIFQLKKHLFESIKKQQKYRSSQNIHDFIKWIKSLWNAVKYEKFIFSFRNSLVAEAYNQLSMKYSELEWNFRKKSHQWMMETENEIQNCPPSELEKDMYAEIKAEMNKVLQEEESIMTEELDKYFESGCKYVHLIERYREDFFRSVTLLRNELADNLGNKCAEVIQIQRGRYEIQNVQDGYIKTIEDKASSLLENCRNAKHMLSDKELECEFERMWNKTLSDLPSSGLKKHNISQEMLEQLRKDMRHKAGYVNEKLNNVKSLAEFGQNGLGKDRKYAQSAWFKDIPETNHTEYWDKVCELSSSLMSKCDSQINEQIQLMKDYHETYCQELLNIINETLNQDSVRNLHLTPLFELDLKLIILGRAAPKFQKIHNNFFQENNPKFCLEKLKAQYYSTFKSIYHEKDESRIRAQRFCEMCLKPAMSEYMYKNLGGKIVDDILSSEDSIWYSSRTFFQFTLLKELLEDEIFDQYIKYNNHYESFVKNWIHKYIINKYKKTAGFESLKSTILASITKKVKTVLKKPKVLNSSSVSHCLKAFCEMLKKDLVISKNEIKAIIFQNTASTQQFISDIESILTNTEEQIKEDMKYFAIESVLYRVTLKPQDELFKKVFGCGKQCPFCKVPCEAGAADHKEHFASVHRPQGLGTYRCTESKALSHSICSTDVVGNTTFQNADTDWKPQPCKDYRKFYPDWTIQPDPTIGASDYWKFVFKEFNKQFSEQYSAKPAQIPEDWYSITKEQALQSLKETFNMM